MKNYCVKCFFYIIFFQIIINGCAETIIKAKYKSKYFKYIGLVQRCEKGRLHFEQCKIDSVGVFIDGNLLLTNFAYHIPFLKKLKADDKFRTTVPLMGASNEKLALTKYVNYTRVQYFEEWKNLSNVDLTNSSLQQLAIIVGETPLTFDGIKMDIISLPTGPLSFDNKQCIIVTYGSKLHQDWREPPIKLMELEVSIVENHFCQANDENVIVEPNFCIHIEGNIINGTVKDEAHGGEPVICDGQLYGIVSAAKQQTASANYYPCASVFNNIFWIDSQMFIFGQQPRRDRKDVTPKRATKYAKYMGFALRKYELIITYRGELFHVTRDDIAIGVLIHNNILLTNFVWDIKEIDSNTPFNTIECYMGGATEVMNYYGKGTTNYTTVNHLQDWRPIWEVSCNKIILSLSPLNVVPTLIFKQLSVVVGHGPIRMDKSMDIIRLADKPLDLADNCVIMTWGDKIYNLTYPPTLAQVKVKLFDIYECEGEIKYTLASDFCIKIQGQITWGFLWGGEPVICNDRLHGVVSRSTGSNVRNKRFYPCVSVYNNLHWINDQISEYGVEMATKSASIRIDFFCNELGIYFYFIYLKIIHMSAM